MPVLCSPSVWERRDSPHHDPHQDYFMRLPQKAFGQPKLRRSATFQEPKTQLLTRCFDGPTSHKRPANDRTYRPEASDSSNNKSDSIPIERFSIIHNRPKSLQLAFTPYSSIDYSFKHSYGVLEATSRLMYIRLREPITISLSFADFQAIIKTYANQPQHRKRAASPPNNPPSNPGSSSQGDRKDFKRRKPNENQNGNDGKKGGREGDSLGGSAGQSAKKQTNTGWNVCPFFYREPDKYPNCAKIDLANRGKLIQHFNRQHKHIDTKKFTKPSKFANNDPKYRSNWNQIVLELFGEDMTLGFCEVPCFREQVSAQYLKMYCLPIPPELCCPYFSAVHSYQNNTIDPPKPCIEGHRREELFRQEALHQELMDVKKRADKETPSTAIGCQAQGSYDDLAKTELVRKGKHRDGTGSTSSALVLEVSPTSVKSEPTHSLMCPVSFHDCTQCDGVAIHNDGVAIHDDGDLQRHIGSSHFFECREPKRHNCTWRFKNMAASHPSKHDCTSTTTPESAYERGTQEQIKEYLEHWNTNGEMKFGWNAVYDMLFPDGPKVSLCDTPYVSTASLKKCWWVFALTSWELEHNVSQIQCRETECSIGHRRRCETMYRGNITGLLDPSKEPPKSDDYFKRAGNLPILKFYEPYSGIFPDMTLIKENEWKCKALPMQPWVPEDLRRNVQILVESCLGYNLEPELVNFDVAGLGNNETRAGSLQGPYYMQCPDTHLSSTAPPSTSLPSVFDLAGMLSQPQYTEHSETPEIFGFEVLGVRQWKPTEWNIGNALEDTAMDEKDLKDSIKAGGSDPERSVRNDKLEKMLANYVARMVNLLK